MTAVQKNSASGLKRESALLIFLVFADHRHHMPVASRVLSLETELICVAPVIDLIRSYLIRRVTTVSRHAKPVLLLINMAMIASRQPRH